MRPRAWLALAALAACVALTAWMAVGSLRSRGPVVPLRVALRIENGLDDTVTVEADARAWLEIERPSDPASRWEGYGVIDPAGTSSPGTGAGSSGLRVPAHESRRFTLRADGPRWARALERGGGGVTLHASVAALADTTRLSGAGAMSAREDSLAHGELRIVLARAATR
jgi:hypothetical protein